MSAERPIPEESTGENPENLLKQTGEQSAHAPLERRGFLKILGTSPLWIPEAAEAAGAAVEQRANPEKEKARELVAELGHYKALEYKLGFSPRLWFRKDTKEALAETPSQEFVAQIQSMMYVLDRMQNTHYSDGPYSYTDLKTRVKEGEHDMNRYLPAELAASGAGMSVAPFYVESDEIIPGKIRLRVRNSLAPEHVLFEREYAVPDKPKDASNEAYPKICSELQEVARRIASDTSRHQRALDAIPGRVLGMKEWKPLFEIFRPVSLPSEAARRMHEFANQWETIYCRIERPEISSGFKDKEVDFHSLRHLDLQKTETHPLLANGQFTFLSLQSKLFDMKSHEPDEKKEYQDSFGNQIVYERKKVYEKEKGIHRGQVTLDIHPPAIFRESASDPKFTQFKYDLSPLGFPDVPPLFLRQANEKLGVAGGQEKYPVFGLSSRLAEKFSKELTHLAEGMAEAEKLFGFSPGTHAKRICISHTKQAGAFILNGQPETVYITERRLRQYEKPEAGKLNPVEDMRLSGRHESFHSIDKSLGIVDKRLTEVFEELNEKFLVELSEGQLIPALQKEKGHAYENATEFFASAINAASHRLIPDVLRRKPPAFRRVYCSCVAALETRLRAIPEIPRDAPIFAKLNRLVADLSRGL